jgi:beta-lactamase superfamily II metal-dependent hydrolase
MKQVLATKAPKVSVLMAPHHGSDKSNIPAFANWAKPKLVVSCQAAPTSDRSSVRMYEKLGSQYLGTWPHGAITIRPEGTQMDVGTYRTMLSFRVD